MFRRMDELGGWTLTDHLLASVVDALHEVGYSALIGPHVDPKKLRKVKPPEPVTRPGARRQRRQASSEDLKRKFGGAAVYRPREG